MAAGCHVRWQNACHCPGTKAPCTSANVYMSPTYMGIASGFLAGWCDVDAQHTGCKCPGNRHIPHHSEFAETDRTPKPASTGISVYEKLPGPWLFSAGRVRSRPKPGLRSLLMGRHKVYGAKALQSRRTPHRPRVRVGQYPRPRGVAGSSVVGIGHRGRGVSALRGVYGFRPLGQIVARRPNPVVQIGRDTHHHPQDEKGLRRLVADILDAAQGAGAPQDHWRVDGTAPIEAPPI